jgi:hypothetical protein
VQLVARVADSSCPRLAKQRQDREERERETEKVVKAEWDGGEKARSIN